MSRPDDSLLNPQQLAVVQRYAQRLLHEASALGRFPTPIDDLVAAAKLTIVDDEVLTESFLKRLSKQVKSRFATIKSALSKVLGLLESNDRLIIIDKNLPAPRIPFITLHETGHGTLPHQREAYGILQDCESTLDPEITDLFEREANVFASEVLFQGNLFSDEAHAHEFSIKTPMKLAVKYGASKYATFRRYVATNPHIACLVALNKITPSSDGGFTAEVRRVVASKSFNTIYDAKTLSSTVTESHVLGPVVPRYGRRLTSQTEIILLDRNKDRRLCMAEAFNSTHQILVLIRDVGRLPSTSIVMPAAGF